MDAELKDKPGRKRTGLVDRLYQDQGRDSDVSEADVYGKYVMDHEPKDPYAQEVGPGAGVLKGIESWLGSNVTEPLAKAGWPRAGAAAAAIPASIADLAIPQTAGDYAGALIPIGKLGKVAKAESKLAKASPEITDLAERLSQKDSRTMADVGGYQLKQKSNGKFYIPGVAGEYATRSEADEALMKSLDEPRSPKTLADIKAMDDVSYARMKKDFLAGAEEEIGKPLTKEEMAAKRAERNQQVMKSEKRVPTHAEMDAMDTDEAVRLMAEKKKPAQQRMNEQTSTARDKIYRKENQARTKRVQDAVEAGEIANVHLMDKDDLYDARSHASFLANKDPKYKAIFDKLDEEEYRRFEARQKAKEEWYNHVSKLENQ